jgi:hypothetical protein
LPIIATDHFMSGYNNLAIIDLLVRLAFFIFTNTNGTVTEGLRSTTMHIFNPLIDQ